MGTRIRWIAAAVLAVGMTACAPTFQNHGYIPPAEDLSLLIVGVDTQDSVEATIGRPATSGIIGDEAWYYIQERRRQFGPRAPQPVSRELLAVSFDEAGTLANIERFGLEQGRVITLSRRVTETSIREFGLIQQLIRNFGRIDIGEQLANSN